MHLGLSHSPNSFQDGSGSWNGSAADALAIWNQYLSKIQFLQAGAVSNSGGDGNNSAFFSKNVYGQTFGSQVLAITLSFSGSGPVFTETDVIFNDNRKWSSYRGPLQLSGTSYTYDFHRVALHEFGHVLGLDHPDEHGQSIDAIMNSVISDRDALADDDIAGAKFLYGQRITSNLLPPTLSFGQALSYQIQAENSPTSFSAIGLPSGLQLNASTGLITGVPERSGTYNVIVTAYGPGGSASGTLRIVMAAPRILSSTFSNATLGSSYTYTITAENHPTSFDATGLSAGLTLNRQTGQISGIPTLSGFSSVTLIAHGLYEDATASLSLQVTSPPTAAETQPVSQFPLRSEYLLADPVRARIYSASLGGITVIDSSTMAVVKTIPTGSIRDLSISPDGNTLWFVRIMFFTLGRVDLNSLALLPDLPFPDFISLAREGSDHRLYAVKIDGSALLQLDATTGAEQLRITPGSVGLSSFTSALALSPDRKFLFLSGSIQINSSTFAPRICRFDVNASTPVFQQGAGPPGTGIAYLLPSLTDDSLFVVPTFYGQTGGAAASRSVLSYNALDFNIERGSFITSGTPVASALSPDGKSLFQVVAQNGARSIEIFDTATFQLLGKIGLGTSDSSSASFQPIAVDRSGAYVITLFYPVNYTNALTGFFDARLAPSAAIPPRSLLNVSTRLRAQTGENVLIGGFVIAGQEDKKMLLRAVGPSLPLSGKLTDPTLELYSSTGAVIAASDNWNEHRPDVLASGLPPKDEHESVIAATLAPGAYTAILRGLGSTAGVALVELYDLSPGTNSRVANLSTRGKVETGDNVMIGGFIIGGDQPTRVIVRALGPSLASNGVNGALADPTVTLYNSSGMAIANNDDWQSDQTQEIIGANLAPTDAREAAFIRTLSPGAYTAIVSGKNGTSGVALVEIFNLESN